MPDLLLDARDDFIAHPSHLGSDLMLVKQALAGATGRPGVKVMTWSSRVGAEPSRPSPLQHIMYQGSKTWWVRMQVVSISVGKSSLPLMMKVKSPYQGEEDAKGCCPKTRSLVAGVSSFLTWQSQHQCHHPLCLQTVRLSWFSLWQEVATQKFQLTTTNVFETILQHFPAYF